MSAMATGQARRALVAAAIVAVIAPFEVGCSLGQGTGQVHSDQLQIPDCWCNSYDLGPDFFAAVPYRDTLQIRVQRGTDLQEVSDGLAVLVDDVVSIRKSFLNKKLAVGLPLGLEPPGSAPISGDAGVSGGGQTDAGAIGEGCGPTEGNGRLEGCPLDLLSAEGSEADTGGPPLVHMALYLQQSCHNQNIILYAVSGTILFTDLFSGDPNEADATQKLTDAVFDIQVGDLRDVPQGAPANAVPKEKLTNLRGCFRFYFERGQPGQLFP